MLKNYIYSFKYKIQLKTAKRGRECLAPKNKKFIYFFRFLDQFSTGTPRSGPTDPSESGPIQIRIHLKVLIITSLVVDGYLPGIPLVLMRNNYVQTLHWIVSDILNIFMITFDVVEDS